MSSTLSKTQTFVKGPAWAAYTAYTVVGTIVCIPAYVAYFAIPAFRPNSRWSLYQTFSNHVTRIVLDYIGTTEYPTAQITSVKVGLGDFIWLEPGPDTLYPTLLQDKAIVPSPVGAVWVPSTPESPAQADRLITLHFHGGAYVTLSPGRGNVQSGPRLLAEHMGTPVLMVDYRLSCNSNSRHPAALQDAITSYRSLLDAGFPASRILLSGDSAGGHLVLMLLRHIAEHGTLPCPAGAALWSPWVDMTDTNASFMANPNAPSDYVTKDLIAWGVREFVPPGESAAGPYFSPARHPFKTDARLFIASGTAEMLLSQHRTIKDAFISVPDNRVQYHEAADAPHDLFAAGKDLGFAQEQIDAIKQAVTFLCG